MPRPEFPLLVKTVPGVVPECCTDESSFLINYDPYVFVKARSLFQWKAIHGTKSSTYGNTPFVWLPYDHALYLMQSLPLLARFFHEQGLCLPKLTLNDLVVTGAGTFRLRGAATSIKFREYTPDNVRDVYSNIRTLLMELVVASVGPDILEELPGDLNSLFQLMMSDGFKHEYRICFHTFFIPLSNKSPALLRIIDAILELPRDGESFQWFVREVLAHKQDWKVIVQNNVYLEQWLQYRIYGPSRREFICYLRAITCHKLEHGLPEKFVDFLVYPVFQDVLKNLQGTSCDMGTLDSFHMEELYLHNARPGFGPFFGETLIAEGDCGDGTSMEVIRFDHVRRMKQANKRVMVFRDGRRMLDHSILAKLNLFEGWGAVQAQECYVIQLCEDHEW